MYIFVYDEGRQVPRSTAKTPLPTPQYVDTNNLTSAFHAAKWFSDTGVRTNTQKGKAVDLMYVQLMYR